jgi:hypothetical protein
MVWPAFWGRLEGATVKPLAPAEVKRVIAKDKLAAPLTADGSWLNIDEHWVEQVLTSLGDGAVYVAGGKLHRLAGGRLQAEDNAQAAPYLWPIAHDVRPATQALGAKGCQDCHSADSAIFFGKVKVDSPLASERTVSWTMARFEKNLDTGYQSRLAASWKYRSMLKAIGLGAAGLLLLVLLAYAVRGIERLSAATVGRLR